MPRLILAVIPYVISVASLLAAAPARASTADAPDDAREAPAHAVVLEGDTLFVLRSGSGELSARERAGIVTARLAAILERPVVASESLRVAVDGQDRWLLYAGEPLVKITPGDAGPAGEGDPDSLAESWRARVGEALVAGSAEANLWRILLHVAGVAGILLLIVGVELLVFRLAARAKRAITRLAAARKLPALRIQRVTLLTQERSQEILQAVFRTLVTAAHVVVAYAALLLLFSVFPWTRHWAHVIFLWSLRPFKAAAQGLIEFLPDLFHILVVLLLAHLFLRLVRRLAAEVEAGNLRLPGFYADWGRPTFNIIRFITYAFALVLIFPKLPGSESTAFRGVTVFLGVLVSLGSTAAFSNIVAGVVMTYMRSFHAGDLIQAGEVRGVVVEKTMLVTRLRTFHGETVTLPNSALLAGNTTNFTTMSRSSGLALHTRVTIGYDVPWRKVEALLLEAARNTPDILKEPEPFVLQSELSDFYVVYELNAYSSDAVRMPLTYSALHQNIQDAFFAAGVEIMSPHYRALRDGNAPAVPADSSRPSKAEGKPGTGEGSA